MKMMNRMLPENLIVLNIASITPLSVRLPKRAKNDGQDAAHGRAFGRCHQARVDPPSVPAIKMPNGKTSPCATSSRNERGPDSRGRRRPAYRMEPDIGHESRRHDQSRHDASHEQFWNRGFREGTVDDHPETRGQQDSERAAGRERARCQSPIIFAPMAEAGQRRRSSRGRHARPAHRGENRASRDIGL